MRMYQERNTFQGKHKHIIFPKHETATKPLCEWLKVQRYQYKLYMGMSRGSRMKADYRFTEERIRLLENIPNFLWQESYTVFLWEKCFDELLEYKETFGNCNVPVPYKIRPELGEFVRTHRVLYGQKRKGINDLLTDEQIDRLEKVGFCWEVKGAVKQEDRNCNSDGDDEARDYIWNIKLGELCEFQSLHGHTDVPSENRNLFQWISEQRFEYCRKELGEYSTMTEEREKQLNEIGFQWKVEDLARNHDSKWCTYFDQLMEVEESSKTHKKLQKWCKSQRKQYRRLVKTGKSKKLNRYQVLALQKIGFKWT
mmetsp:Transcript_24358/g.35404  ORF Transcript_24358/g.35404 Transcript_24358/m.35404 type:complete len:311 (+) Transcript_24358:265-1197(+)